MIEPILDDEKIQKELMEIFKIELKEIYKFVIQVRNIAWGKGYNEGLKNAENNYYKKESN